MWGKAIGYFFKLRRARMCSSAVAPAAARSCAASPKSCPSSRAAWTCWSGAICPAAPGDSSLGALPELLKRYSVKQVIFTRTTDVFIYSSQVFLPLVQRGP